jgi:hypothetical protein
MCKGNLTDGSLGDFLQVNRLVAGRAPTADHLRQKQGCLEDRARGKSSCEPAEQLAGTFVVIEPPKVRNKWKSIDVNVLRINEFE